MIRFVAMLLLCLTAVSLVAGAVSHAAEPVVCLSDDAAVGMDHAAGDGDQGPADDGKPAPHHHGGCHGHHVTLASEPDAALDHPSAAQAALAATSAALPHGADNPALRPPIA